MDTVTRRRPVRHVARSLAALFLALAVAGSVSNLRGAVDPGFDPNVHVQLDPGGIVVGWVSAAEEDGLVEWALSASDLAGRTGSFNTATDFRGAFAGRANKRTHRVEAKGAPGGSTIHYQIVSGGVTAGPQSATLPSQALTLPPNVVTGLVTYPDASLGSECVVFMRVTNKEPLGPGSSDAHSLWVNGQTSVFGEYALDITNIRGDPANQFFNNNIDQAFSYNASSATSEITVIAQCDPDYVGQTVKTTLGAGFTGSAYQNFDIQLAGAPSLSIDDVTVGEADGTARVTVSIGAPAISNLTVDYATLGGTATAPGDYTATAATATIPAGALATTLSIPIIDDGIQEPDETFIVVLSNPTGGAVISSTAGSATVTIIDDDGPPTPQPVFDPSVHVELLNSADGIAVNWTSVDEDDGHVEWALSAADLAASPTIANDDRGDFASRLNKRTHRVNIRAITGGSTIHFNIVSGGVTDPNGPYQVTIPSVALTSPPDLLTGVVRYPDSTLGLQCIVSMRVTNKEPFGPGSADAHSLWVTGITNGGGYTLDITNIRGNPANAFFNNNLNAAFQYATSAATSEITVKAECDPDNVGQTVKTTLDAGFSAGYQNFDVQLAPLSPTFSIADVSVGEGTGAATLTISLQPAANGSTAVSWATSDGTAMGPADYTASSGTVLFAAGVTSKAVTVPVTDDAVDEPDETFSVTLSNATGASIGVDTAAVTIVDDDGPPAPQPAFDPSVHVELLNSADGIAVNWTSIDEDDGHVEWALSAADLVSSPNVATDVRGELASRLNKRTHRVTVTGVTGGSTIHFNIVSGGVTDPNGPYQVTIPTVALTSPPNLLTGVVRHPNSTLGLQCIVSMRVTNIDPLGTGVDHHSMWVTGITNGGGYTLDITNMRGNPANAFFNNNVDAAFQYATSAATSEITVKAECDPDNVGQTVKTTLDAGFSAGYQNFDVQLASAPRLSIANVGVGEPAPSVTLTISTDAAATSDLTVDYATSDGTATAPDDYTATAGTATIPAGMLATTVSIPIVNDSVEEPAEEFTVTLSNPTGGVAISAVAGSATVTIFDDDVTLIAIPGLGALGLAALAGLLVAALLWKRMGPTPASRQRHF